MGLPLVSTHPAAEIVDIDVKTGRRTGLASMARRALACLNDAEIPYAVVGAAALAVRGLPRNTQDLDVVVLGEDAHEALRVLGRAGFRSIVPVKADQEPEPMYALIPARGKGELDVLVGWSEPESTIVAEAPMATVFGVEAPVATLEHLLLMLLYSNQPRHEGDFARIVTEGGVDLGWVDSYLEEVHPEMREVLRARIDRARNPPPAPAKPPRRRGTSGPRRWPNKLR